MTCQGARPRVVFGNEHSTNAAGSAHLGTSLVQSKSCGAGVVFLSVPVQCLLVAWCVVSALSGTCFARFCELKSCENTFDCQLLVFLIAGTLSGRGLQHACCIFCPWQDTSTHEEQLLHGRRLQQS